MSCPILNLPQDVLLDIFEAGCQRSLESTAETKPKQPFPLLVSSVCQHWRKIAIFSSTLWTSIFITDPLIYNIDLFFERSKYLLLDVTIDTCVQQAPTLSRQNYMHISTLLSSHASRLRWLVVKVDYSEEAKRVTDMLQTKAMENLEGIEISLSLELDIYSDDHHDRILQSTPSLRFLKIIGLCQSCLPPLVGLTHLELLEFAPSASQFQDLFRNCPALSTLILPSLSPPTEPESGDGANLQPIETLSLQNLAIAFKTGYMTVAESDVSPLSLLSAPNLDYLEISINSSPLLSLYLQRMLKSWQSNPKKRKVRFDSLHLSQGDVSFMHCLPNSVDLELIYILDSNITDGGEDILAEALSLPNIHSLTANVSYNSDAVRNAILSKKVTFHVPFTLCMRQNTANAAEDENGWRDIAVAAKGNFTVDISPPIPRLLESTWIGENSEDADSYYHSDIDPDFDFEYEFDEDAGEYEDEYDEYDDDEGLELYL